MQPGGHVDIGEGPSDAALRESQEETGLALSHPAGGPRLIHLDVHPAADGHTHLDLRYLLLGADADPSPPPGESPEVRWCTWEEADALSDAALTGALRAARRQPEAQQFLGEAGGVTTSESVNGATKHKSPDGWRTSQGPTRASSHESHGGAMGHNGG
jgi:ADP-ribose pyrophosphatase YjhB (NUDIX family)